LIKAYNYFLLFNLAMDNMNLPVVTNGHSAEDSPKPNGNLTRDTPNLSHDEGKITRKTLKGHVESADIKKSLNLSDEPQINHITCN
jgi:hypothetical protein